MTGQIGLKYWLIGTEIYEMYVKGFKINPRVKVETLVTDSDSIAF